MKKFIDELKKDKKKLYTSGLALLLLIIMFVSATYAYFKNTDASNTDFGTTVSTNTTDSLVFETGGDISFTASPANFNEGMGNQEGSTFLKATLKANNKTNQASAKYFVYLDITENDFGYSQINQVKPGLAEMQSYNVLRDNLNNIKHLASIDSMGLILGGGTPELLLQLIDPTGKEWNSEDYPALRYLTVEDGNGESISGFDITTMRNLITIASNYEINSTGIEIQEWQFKVIFVNLPIDQQINGGKKFNAKLIIKKEDSGVIKPVDNNSFWKHKDSIKNIVIENELTPYENAAYKYDISLIQDESVMAYLIDNGDETYTAYIQGDGKVIANPDSSYLFKSFSILETIYGLNYLDTSQVQYMNYMFSGCRNLITIDNVSEWDVSQVIDMSNMFEECNSLTGLDISKWDTSKVTNMSAMFSCCRSLTSLDVINWNTSKVINMNNMFSGCSGLTTVDVSKFDTSQVQYMGNMFSGCSSLTNLDVSNWNTNKVIAMFSMFENCNNLTSLDLSNWDTSNGVNIRNMFSSCSSLTNLNISKWDTSKAIDMSNMFSNCSNLINLEVRNWDTSQVTNMGGMFFGCSSLTTLDISKWKTSSVTNMANMFSNCSSLTNLDASAWDTSKVTSMSYMFLECSGLTNLDLSKWKTSNVTNMRSMFSGCSGLTSLDIRSATFNNATKHDDMFLSVSSGIQVIVKDEAAKTFIEARLTDVNKNGTVTIA